ncbi:acyl-CoA dehydrogenase [Legionella israelensis]|uniref:Acyl-CoA dehydrogenase n=1 Tax=Legionella israelensis TaxID=454 RepID=A0AAX1EHE9_9GAMM|nr:acyl-CoA dehydrogenase family protein [Legionella israelensis]QBR84457.1 acyl-CoA dehydrogenase [Legionella israelensis]
MAKDNAYQQTRHHFQQWQEQLKSSLLAKNSSLMHTFNHYFAGQPEFVQSLADFASEVSIHLEPVVMDNNLDVNLPHVEHYNAIGERNDRVIHHPSYIKAGDIIYGCNLMRYLRTPGQMLKTLSLFLLSSHAGEAGHNCPIACSAGIIRLLNKYPGIKDKEKYLDKLTTPSFKDNFTGAQFLTEIQGGSDVGANITQAYQDENQQWRIKGEKWFCSNANAELILLTARFDENISGTKGLGLFLVPFQLDNGQSNHYRIRRLKQKIGTRSMATGEIDFEDAKAYLIGEPKDGIHLVMENVLHVSRIFNAFSVLGMARRAYQTAYYYALNRQAFQHPIIEYPLVKERLAHIKAENTAMLASVFHMAHCQDKLDQQNHPQASEKLLLRILANLNKYFTAMRSVENIHHCLDILAGNGTIETFSSLPRLLRDCIVCENWEGTHFVLWMQIVKDINKFQVDEIFLHYLDELLSKIENQHDQYEFYENKQQLKKELNTFKSLNLQEQSLKIQFIVKKMITLLSAITLILELQHDEPPVSKKASLILFVRKYLNPEYHAEENYLDLLEKVLG